MEQENPDKGAENSGADLQMIFGCWFVLTILGLLVLWQALPAETPVWLTIFDALGIIVGTLTSMFVVVSAGFMYVKRDTLINRLKNRLARPEFYNTGHPFEEKVEAVIIPVSNRGTEQPEWIINNLKPKRVALLCSRESCPNGTRLLKETTQCKFVNNPLDLLQGAGEILENPRDPQEVKNLTKYFIAELIRQGVPRGKIFVDTTGGLVPTSIGAFQGAEEEGVSSIYINGTVGPNNFIKDPLNPEHGEPIFLSDRTADAHL